MDLRLIETGKGGDLLLNGNDFLWAFSFENFPYIGMFGGNPQQSTPPIRIESEQNFDFWGNELLGLNYNSQTENLINSVGLNSSTRILIENAVKEDLKFMLEFAEISVIVRLVGLDVIEINITIVQPENGVERKYIYLWDGLQLVDNSGIGGQNAPNLEGLQEVLQINL